MLQVFPNVAQQPPCGNSASCLLSLHCWWSNGPLVQLTTKKLTEVNLPVASSPHRVAVVDADVLPLLDVHRCSDNHPVREGLGYFDQNDHLEPEVSVEVFACIVDAGVLQ